MDLSIWKTARGATFSFSRSTRILAITDKVRSETFDHEPRYSGENRPGKATSLGPGSGGPPPSRLHLYSGPPRGSNKGGRLGAGVSGGRTSAQPPPTPAHLNTSGSMAPPAACASSYSSISSALSTFFRRSASFCRAASSPGGVPGPGPCPGPVPGAAICAAGGKARAPPALPQRPLLALPAVPLPAAPPPGLPGSRTPSDPHLRAAHYVRRGGYMAGQGEPLLGDQDFPTRLHWSF